ncbi:MAG: hypothetical protein ACLT75_09430, partial [Alistipes putredinis]
IYRQRWKYARPCESPEGRALRISIPGILLVATVGIGGFLRPGRYPADCPSNSHNPRHARHIPQ